MTIVQESRMQITDDQGVSHLFLLGANAAAEPSDLEALQRRQARVRVRYTPAPNMVANVISTIEVA